MRVVYGLVLAILLASCSGNPAFAQPLPVVPQSPASQARVFSGCTVTASSATCLASGLAQQWLQIQNASATASIACAFGAAAVLNASGSVQLAPGQPASWGPNTLGVPPGALNCIGSTSSVPLYIEYR